MKDLHNIWKYPASHFRFTQYMGDPNLEPATQIINKVVKDRSAPNFPRELPNHGSARSRPTPVFSVCTAEANLKKREVGRPLHQSLPLKTPNPSSSVALALLPAQSAMGRKLSGAS